jgi:hypothetical protein
MEGLEWVLKIYDPQALVNFSKAVKSKDIYKQRQIAYKAITKNLTAEEFFVNASNNPNIISEAHIDKNGKFKAGELIYDKDAPEGLTFAQTGQHWNKNKAENNSDIDYPIDVRVINSPEYKDYYKENDFIGAYDLTGGIIVKGNTSKAILFGHLKGSGYVRYQTVFFGATNGLRGLQAETAIVQGKFSGSGSFDQTALEGWGTQSSFGTGILIGGFWQGYSNKGDALGLKKPTFLGSFYGLSTTLNFDFLRGKNKKSPSVTGQQDFHIQH